MLKFCPPLGAVKIFVLGGGGCTPLDSSTRVWCVLNLDLTKTQQAKSKQAQKFTVHKAKNAGPATAIFKKQNHGTYLPMTPGSFHEDFV